MGNRFKFRAWDNFREKMIYDKVSEYVSFNDNGSLNTTSVMNNNVMQYTGLKDKTGKEIYEGDIGKHNNGELYKIIWDQEDTRFICPNINAAKFHDIYYLLKSFSDRFEIVGNIYENPELLN